MPTNAFNNVSRFLKSWHVRGNTIFISKSIFSRPTCCNGGVLYMNGVPGSNPVSILVIHVYGIKVE
jgi:hypothetical protein